MNRPQILLFFLVALLALFAQAIKNHADHSHIFLENEHIHVPSAKHFHTLQHPNAAESMKTLEERLDDPLKHTFLVHFASKEDVHSYAQETIHDDPEVMYEGYVPQGGFIVHATHQKALELSAKPFIDWVGYYKPEHKLNAKVGVETESKTIIAILMHKFTKEELNQMAADWIASSEEFQQQVELDTTDGSKRIHLKVTSGSEEVIGRLIEYLSHQREVYSVNRKMIMKQANKWSKSIIQMGNEDITDIYELAYWNEGITGQGQVVGFGDGGLDYRSCFFADEESLDPNPPPFYNWVDNPTPEEMFREEDSMRRKIVQYVTGGVFGDDTPSGSHGTGVGGCIAGYPVNDEVYNFRADSGAARDAKLAFFDMEIGSNGGGVNVPPDAVNQFFPWAYAAGARIHTNSFAGINPNYDDQARQFDEYMYLQKDFLTLVSASNDGDCGAQLATSGSPASAKNIIAVGASINSKLQWEGNPFNDEQYRIYEPRGAVFDMESMASFSSQGPTGDGRIKPEVSVPGMYVQTANNLVHEGGSMCNLDNYWQSYTFGAGTSLSSPTLAGNLALLRQYLIDGYYPSGRYTPANGFIPSGSLMKAITINGAVKMKGQKVSYATQTIKTVNDPIVRACEDSGTIHPLPDARPNFKEGFGRFQLNQVAYVESFSEGSFLFIPSQNLNNGDIFSDSRISGGQVHSYDFCAFENIADREIRITLVWTDAPGAVGSDFALVNDLDLVVTFRGETIYGNTQSGVLWDTDNYLRESKGISTTTEKDSVNPVESVYLWPASPEEAKVDLKIEVHGASIPQGPQPYSLVVTGFLAQGRCSEVSQAGPPIRRPRTTRRSLALPLGIAGGALFAAGCAAVIVYKRRKNSAVVGQTDNVKLLGNAL